MFALPWSSFWSPSTREHTETANKKGKLHKEERDVFMRGLCIPFSFIFWKIGGLTYTEIATHSLKKFTCKVRVLLLIASESQSFMIKAMTSPENWLNWQTALTVKKFFLTFNQSLPSCNLNPLFWILSSRNIEKRARSSVGQPLNYIKNAIISLLSLLLSWASIPSPFS